ncbi:Uncharacterised protein [Streptococcus pneumoniae]|nr:Uncharacterised protein [Streptococcus pneumoniae]
MSFKGTLVFKHSMASTFQTIFIFNQIAILVNGPLVQFTQGLNIQGNLQFFHCFFTLSTTFIVFRVRQFTAFVGVHDNNDIVLQIKWHQVVF